MTTDTQKLNSRDEAGGSAGRGVLMLFVLVHLSCFAAVWTGVSWWAVGLCFALYFVRMFAITAGYHRYFSHRSYRMGRVMQFIMAFLAMTSAQKGVIWWSSHHRHHHKHSDTEDDVHSPRHGFWHSHLGWIVGTDHDHVRTEWVRDLMKFPELRWLDRHVVLPPFVMGLVVWLAFGWQGLVVGFLWSTVLTWHGTFTINSLSHVFGRKRYETGDDSRNNWLLALITMGEGWHNNHHHYQRSTNQGFRWWEIDVTFYILWMLSKVGLVSDLQRAPRHIVTGERHPKVVSTLRDVIERKQARVP